MYKKLTILHAKTGVDFQIKLSEFIKFGLLAESIKTAWQNQLQLERAINSD